MDNPAATARFGSQHLDWNSITLFDNRNAMDCVSTEGFSAHTISFDHPWMLGCANDLDLELPGSSSKGLENHRLVDPMQMTRIRSLLREFSQAMIVGNQQTQHNAVTSVEADLPYLLLRAWNSGKAGNAASPGNRRRVLNRALAYIEAHQREYISVQTLSRECATSLSTLERAFREQFGLSPKQYLVCVRLSGARRDLLKGSQSKISDIAGGWGFWHMSKFAQDYRRLYGELPSETRRGVVF